MSDRARNSSWMGWVLLCGGLFLTALAVFRFIPDMQAALHEPETLGLDEHLTNVQVERASWLSVSNGGRWGR